MNKVIEFIIESVDKNPNNQTLGEEVRATQETLFFCYIETGDELYEFLFALIQLTPNDYELGEKIRRIKSRINMYNND